MSVFRIQYAIKYHDAIKYHEDATMLYGHARFNSAMSRLYYASFHAMWAALGDPETGRTWKHLAIIKPFVHGFWFSPSHGRQSAGLLENFRLPLRQMLEMVDNVIKSVTEYRKQL
ncbi:MAG: hypothetical protein HZA20_04100 [Nitrospirae bacterium]|nr:hypothetical protein [Nitrospirota bacterium]